MTKPDPNLAWGALILAGLFEVGFTSAMSAANQGKAWANIVFLACVIASFALLSFAVRTIPVGIGYAVWTGIGAAGTLLVSAFIFKQPINVVQMGLVAVLIAVVIGLKLASSSP